MSFSRNRYIELLEVSRKNNVYSSLVSYTIGEEKLKLRFAIEKIDYGLLKRILEFRPLENTGVAPYRYYFTRSHRKDEQNEKLGFIEVKVKQMDRLLNYDFKLSRRYISNIIWFYTLTSSEEIKEMIEP